LKTLNGSSLAVPGEIPQEDSRQRLRCNGQVPLRSKFETDGTFGVNYASSGGRVLAFNYRTIYWIEAARKFARRLTHMHKICILMHMRSTLNIDDELLRRAAELAGERQKTALVRMGLEALIARESARRLAKLGGSEHKLQAIPRRRMGRPR
jgi:hypothetical protein